MSDIVLKKFLEALNEDAEVRLADVDKLWNQSCQEWSDSMDDESEAEKARDLTVAAKMAWRAACGIAEGYRNAMDYKTAYDKAMLDYGKAKEALSAYRKEKENG